MGSSNFKLNGRHVDLQLGSRPCLDVAVLAADMWAFVDHWMLAQTVDTVEAREYWRQAERFSAHLHHESYEAHPLHLYYMILNAVKAMLVFRSTAASDFFRGHGASFKLVLPTPKNAPPPTPKDPLLLPGYITQPQDRGVFQVLTDEMGDNSGGTLDFEDLLASVPWVHRAWQTLRPAESERFLTLHGPVRLKTDGSDVYFEVEVANHSVATIGPGTLPVQTLARYPATNKEGTPTEVLQTVAKLATTDVADIEKFNKYHQFVRRHFDIISQRDGVSYYMRRADSAPVALSQISINFAISLGLSSLARYHPGAWRGQLEGPNGWLLKEYLRATPQQFLALIAGEITGRIIQRPYSDLR